MRDASTYRCNWRRRDHGLGNAKELKWWRKRRGISRSELDRERGEIMNPQQAAATKRKLENATQ